MTSDIIQGKLLISFDAKVQEAPCFPMLTNISCGDVSSLKAHDSEPQHLAIITVKTLRGKTM